MNEMKHNRRSNGDRFPEAPLIGRFVSPWDTSGWYSVFANFDRGVFLHSNEAVTVSDLPARYIGADYIMTFNSAAEGFDDKQEVDFSCERDATIAVGLDSRMDLPEFTRDFTSTDDRIVGSDGRKYRIFERTYKRGEAVHIPGISGDGNHFIVLAVPASREEAKAAPALPVLTENVQPYEGRTYKSYLCEVFNREDALSAYDTAGCTLACREACTRDRFVLVAKGGHLTYALPKTSSRLVMTARVGGTMTVSFAGTSGVLCGVKVRENKVVTLADAPISDFEGGEVSLRLVLDTEKGECKIWVSSRLAVTEKMTAGVPTELSFAAEGKATLDDLYLFDDTEIYAENTDFGANVNALTASKGAVLTRSDIPFESDGSASLSGENAYAEARFPAISGLLTVETKVRARGDFMTYVPALTDGDGNAACRIALYRNCLFATDGGEWVELFEGLTDWQYYPADNFYNISVTLDTAKKTYSLMVDGAVRAKDFAFENACESISRAVYFTEGGELLIKRIRVFDAADFSRGVMPNAPVFDVSAAPYFAKGDGTSLDTLAIQKAIDDAAFTGGTVYLHDGTFFTGELFLRSDMTFFVAPTATLLGTQDHGEYPLQEPNGSLCAHRQLGRGLIYGTDIKNVRITGGGMLDGNGRYRFKMNDPSGDRRVFDARPDIVYITYSENVTVEYINFKSSAFWTVVPLSSKNVILRRLNLDCMNTPNRDGIDPVDCHDMTIYGCQIMAGDDGLCFKSSDPVGCYNIFVDDMMIQSLASGIKFGTDTYYCLKNAHIRGCTVKNVNRCGISLETVDGAAVEDVLFERIDMTDVGAPVYITVGNRNRLPRIEGIGERMSYIKGVTFSELRFENAYPFSYTKNIREVMAVGQNESQRLENVTFRKCRFTLAGGFTETPDCPRTIDKRYPEYDRHGLSAGSAFTVRYAKNFAVTESEITFEKPDTRPLVAKFDYEG